MVLKHHHGRNRQGLDRESAASRRELNEFRIFY
jgi:hypothetical protein